MSWVKSPTASRAFSTVRFHTTTGRPASIKRRNPGAEDSPVPHQCIVIVSSLDCLDMAVIIRLGPTPNARPKVSQR